MDNLIPLNESDEMRVSTNTWNKMCKHVSKEGFREGASAGRETTFQNGFDIGYAEGYNTGFSLGFMKGVLTAVKSQNVLPPTSDSSKLSDVPACLVHSSKGLCQMCSDGSSSETDPHSVPEIMKHQMEATNGALSLLRHSYSDILNHFNINMK